MATKACKRCGIEVLEDNFPRCGEKKDGTPYYRAVCQPCRSDDHREWIENNPERAAENIENNREKAEERSRIYEANNRESRKVSRRNNELKRQYGITLEDYEKMMVTQGGRCLICGQKDDKTLCVDHCHISGQVRGLLCRSCNFVLGLMKDDPLRLRLAADYLENN